MATTTTTTTTTSTLVSSVSASFASLNEGAESLWWSGEAPITHSNILYGRTEETVQLLMAYYSLMNSQTSQTVMVHGDSGSGKTSLVDQLRTAAVDSDGYFVSGKFFQKQAGPNEP
jgi:DNA-binding NtrC family response regulator